MPVSDYTPAVDVVARKLLSRTRDSYGNEVGTFTADTRPTATQAAAITNDIITEIADRIGDDIPQALWNDASNVVALRSAMQIELDFFSEQVNTGRSIYPQLERLYNNALNSLASAVTLTLEGGDGKIVDSSPGRSPSGGFPDAANWLTRRW